MNGIESNAFSRFYMIPYKRNLLSLYLFGRNLILMGSLLISLEFMTCYFIQQPAYTIYKILRVVRNDSPSIWSPLQVEWVSELKSIKTKCRFWRVLLYGFLEEMPQKKKSFFRSKSIEHIIDNLQLNIRPFVDILCYIWHWNGYENYTKWIFIYSYLLE